MGTKMIVDKFLPFTFFSGTAWTELVEVLTSDHTPVPGLPAWRVKNLIVDIYFAIKKAGCVHVLFYEWTRQRHLSNYVLVNLCTVQSVQSAHTVSPQHSNDHGFLRRTIGFEFHEVKREK